jgi:hypothetical protein
VVAADPVVTEDWTACGRTELVPGGLKVLVVVTADPVGGVEVTLVRLSWTL